jgi:hypothetical protein
MFPCGWRCGEQARMRFRGTQHQNLIFKCALTRRPRGKRKAHGSVPELQLGGAHLRGAASRIRAPSKLSPPPTYFVCFLCDRSVTTFTTAPVSDPPHPWVYTRHPGWMENARIQSRRRLRNGFSLSGRKSALIRECWRGQLPIFEADN